MREEVCDANYLVYCYYYYLGIRPPYIHLHLQKEKKKKEKKRTTTTHRAGVRGRTAPVRLDIIHRVA